MMGSVWYTTPEYFDLEIEEYEKRRNEHPESEKVPVILFPNPKFVK